VEKFGVLHRDTGLGGQDAQHLLVRVCETTSRTIDDLNDAHCVRLSVQDWRAEVKNKNIQSVRDIPVHNLQYSSTKSSVRQGYASTKSSIS
jgi:hypothetical protein